MHTALCKDEFLLSVGLHIW